MRELSSWNTFITKYLVTAMWAFGPTVVAITVYNNFGQTEGFYLIPFFFLPALIFYMPMKISFDEKKIVVSDLFTRKEYKFKDIKSLEFSRPTISYHPYRQLILILGDNEIVKIKFIPRTLDTFSLIFTKELQGRQKELKDLWADSTTANTVLMQ